MDSLQQHLKDVHFSLWIFNTSHLQSSALTPFFISNRISYGSGENKFTSPPPIPPPSDDHANHFQSVNPESKPSDFSKNHHCLPEQDKQLISITLFPLYPTLTFIPNSGDPIVPTFNPSRMAISRKP
ncbi:hypothetical protein ElyMa_003545300 [Elysia marginata]|uniref:Uncharacterized protein n=1 Tax=Elysia marginata TaxID=1093978 RepID=A0AAV4EKI1_9GAST|nr:hypothetical protein ElyMa_003545300 [Elysia marginata]